MELDFRPRPRGGGLGFIGTGAFLSAAIIVLHWGVRGADASAVALGLAFMVTVIADLAVLFTYRESVSVGDSAVHIQRRTLWFSWSSALELTRGSRFEVHRSLSHYHTPLTSYSRLLRLASDAGYVTFGVGIGLGRARELAQALNDHVASLDLPIVSAELEPSDTFDEWG